MAALHSSLEIMQSLDEDPLLGSPLLPSQMPQSDIRPRFHPVPTVFVSVLLLLVNISFVALSFVAFVVCLLPEEKDVCKPYLQPLSLQSAILSGKVILWLLLVVHERCLQHHHSKVRSRGYLSFYRTTRHLKSLPLLVHSTGNAALLLVVSVQLSFNVDFALYYYFTLAVLALELLATLLFLSIYSVKIGRFNRTRQRPDIIEDEKVQASPLFFNPQIGFRDGTSMDEVVEKQGDMIEYLHRHNAMLSKRLIALSSQQMYF